MELRPCAIKLIDLHHTASNEANTAVVRAVHLARGWGDIGYNAVIEPDGTVGKGRDTKYSGAHDIGKAPNSGWTMNQCSYAISHIGNFERSQMGESQFWASVRHCVEVCKLYGILPSRHTIRKHSDQSATACPGKNFPYERYLAEVVKLYEGAEKDKSLLDCAVVYFTPADYSVALIYANKAGGCAMFCRNAQPKAHPDAMRAKKVYTIGGPQLGHPNEIYLSGDTAADTLMAAADYLKGARK